LSGILALYSIVAIYLILGQYSDDRIAIQSFMQAWQDDTYQCEKCGFHDVADVTHNLLKIQWQAGLESQAITVDYLGRIITGPDWQTPIAPVRTTRKRVRKAISKQVEQIVTMYKLQEDNAHN